MRHTVGAVFCLAILVAPFNAASQELPADYTIDIQLGLVAVPRMTGGNSEIIGTPANTIGSDVFGKLVTNYSQPYPWKLTLVNAGVVNASSTPGGQVYVYGGLIPLLGQNKGLWAAVLSHEVAHTGERHGVKLYLREEYNANMIQYYRLRVQAGDNSANYALAAFQISSAILLRKMEREQEHDADQRGMLMMARAGYHPDFVFALHHLLAMNTGEQSKFGAFFSNHPRWETRDQRSDRVYSDALAEFNRSWPDAAASPGGKPPLVAFVGKPESIENKDAGSADIKVPIYCRNSDTSVEVRLLLQKNHHAVKSSSPEFSDKNGDFSAHQQSDCADKDDALPVSFHIPSTAVADHDRSTQAEVLFFNGADLLATSKPFDVHFPKIKKK